MKNSLFTLLFALFLIESNAQIFSQRQTNESITITPKGLSSKFSNTFNSSNTALGEEALSNSSSSSAYNTAIGQYALYENVGNWGSTAIGHRAMYRANNQTSGVFTYNTALGYFALTGGSTPSSNSGFHNTAIGTLSLTANTSGYKNTGVGSYSLPFNDIGNYNVAIGTEALLFNTSGSNNVAVGWQSLYNNVANSRTTAIGSLSLYNADNRTTGRSTYNTAIGYRALYGSSTPANNTGQYNTAVGDEAMLNNTSGSYNTAIGVQSLYNNTTGTNNTILGYQAGISNTIGSRNVFIGYQAGYNHDADDILVIENSNGNRALIRGDFANDKVAINRLKSEIEARTETFQVEGEAFKTTGTGNWIIPSDRRLKENIVYLNSQETLDKVLKMKGVSYNWIDKSRGKDKVIGFIAQDLQQVFPENVKTDKEGFLSASYGAYDPMIVESIKALKELIDEQRKMLLKQNEHIENQQKEIDNLKGMLASDKKEFKQNVEK